MRTVFCARGARETGVLIALVVCLTGVLLSITPRAGVAASTSFCHAAVMRGSLPQWARSGFSHPTRPVPHVVGRYGNIVAILFAYPLLVPPPLNHNNKILWVARSWTKPITPLRIKAQLMQGGTRLGAPVTRTVRPGPGPSVINLPSAGCWRLTLAWSGRTDTLDLNYRSRSV